MLPGLSHAFNGPSPWGFGHGQVLHWRHDFWVNQGFPLEGNALGTDLESLLEALVASGL